MSEKAGPLLIPVAIAGRNTDYRVREDRGDYDPAPESEHFYRAQGLVGEAWNLAGLLLKSLEDEGDTRAMQIHTAVSVIEERLREAHRHIDELDAERAR